METWRLIDHALEHQETMPMPRYDLDFPLVQNIGDVTVTNGAQAFVGTFTFHNHSVEPKANAAKVCQDALFRTFPAVDRAALISAKGKRVTGTCEWVQEDATYQAWLQDGASLLSICGGPGKGKTMLAIFLSEQLESLVSREEDSVVLYFFCSSGDEEHSSAVSILRSLVWQVIQQRPSVAESIVKDLDTTAKANVVVHSREALWSIYTRVSQRADRWKVYCVLDGLDECDEDSKHWLAAKIADMPWNQSAMKLLLLSRDKRLFRNSEMQIRLDLDNDLRVAGDIESFVAARIAQLHPLLDLAPASRDAVKQQLIQRSEDTFLWVGLAMNELLLKRTMVEIEETLAVLPKGLPSIYERMLRQIKGHRYRRECAAILRWLAAAVRPLLFRELAVVISIESPSSIISREQALRDCLLICGPFINVHGETITLVHQTAKAYLTGQDIEDGMLSDEFTIQLEQAHLQIARTCLDVLGESSFRDTPLETTSLARQAVPQLLWQQNAFLPYALAHWPHHAAYNQHVTEQLLSHSSAFFEKHSKLRENWWRLYAAWLYPATLPGELPPLHMASFLGLDGWIHKLLKGERLKPRSWRSINRNDQCDFSPLHLAARQGHLAAVRLLLDGGARLDPVSKAGRTPLHEASEKGWEAVVSLLISRGASLDFRDHGGNLPLNLAAIEGHEAVVRSILSSKRADVNRRNEMEMTALHMAAFGGNENVVKLLIGQGAPVDARDWSGKTALFEAAASGHLGVAQALLDHDADVNANDDSGCRPLHGTVYALMIQLLLDHHAEINAEDNAGQTALNCVVGMGYKHAAELLLSRGAKVHTADTDGRTLLHVAATSNQAALVPWLLELSVDPAAKNRWGYTAYHTAIMTGHEHVAELLKLSDDNEDGVSEDLLSMFNKGRHRLGSSVCRKQSES